MLVSLEKPRKVCKVYHFSVDYNSIDKSDILNINRYLMNTNDIKWYSALLNKCLLYYYVSENL